MLWDNLIACCQIALSTSVEHSLTWIFNPVDDSRPHVLSETIKWHARFMSLGWSFFFPVAILAARYYKVTPRQRFPEELDNQWWWNTHRICVALGSIAVVVAASLVWTMTSDDQTVNTIHQYAGWTALVLFGVQIASGLLRGTTGGPKRPSYSGGMRGDHYDMTVRRIVFERVHKSVGYVALFCAWFATLAGLWTVNAPIWIWLAVVSWWTVLIFFAVRLQLQQRAIDTYQAIWGTQPTLKGNQISSIGIGIRRVDHPTDN